MPSDQVGWRYAVGSGTSIAGPSEGPAWAYTAWLLADFLDFAAKEGLFATFLTPSADDPGKRWDTARNAALSEILGF